MVKKKMENCNCVEKANEALKEQNTFIESKLMMNFETGDTSLSPPMIVVGKLDSKKKEPLPVLFCSYCPFCGKKIN